MGSLVATRRSHPQSQVRNKPIPPRDRQSHLCVPVTAAGPAIQAKCACGGTCPRCHSNALIQAKLTIGEPNDQYEQEADRVADEVMRMPAPAAERRSEIAQGSNAERIQGSAEPGYSTALIQRQQEEPEEEVEEIGEEEAIQTKPLDSTHAPLVQRELEQEERPESEDEEEQEPVQTKLADGFQVQRQEEEPEEEEEKPIQTKPAGSQLPRMTTGLETRIRSLRSGGQPLPLSSRKFFEPRFRHDFSQVRLHTGLLAGAVAHSLKARALTFGPNIVFGAGQFAPTTDRGKHLLAHELAHVLQQARKARGSDLKRARQERTSENYNFLARFSFTAASHPYPPDIQCAGDLPSSIKDISVTVFGKTITNKLIQFWERKIQTETDPRKRQRYQRNINRLRAHSKPTGSQSEAEIASIYKEIGGEAERSYKSGRVVKHGKKGSTRPDTSTHSTNFEVKARSIVRKEKGRYVANTKNQSSIISAINRQISERKRGSYKGKTLRGPTPSYSRPALVLDLRGQKINTKIVLEFIRKVIKKTDLRKVDIQLVVNEGQIVSKRQRKRISGRAANARRWKAPGRRRGMRPTPKPETASQTSSKVVTGSRGTCVERAKSQPRPVRSKPAVRPPAPETPVKRAARSTVLHPGGRQTLRPGGRVERGPSIRTSLKGTVGNIGAGLLLGIVLQSFKKKMLNDLAKLPKPKIDRRSVGKYLSDPRTKKGVRIIDLFNKQIRPFGKKLREHHEQLLSGSFYELIRTDTRKDLTPIQKAFYIQSMIDEIEEYGRDLSIVKTNVDAALALGPKMEQSARNADALVKLIRPSVAWLFNMGFTVEEISQIESNLLWWAASIRKVIRDLKWLRSEVVRYRKAQAMRLKSIRTLFFRRALKEMRTASRRR